MNRRRCEICDFEIHKASYCRHLRSAKHIKNGKKMMEMMLNPYYYTDKCYTASGIKINVDIDRINQLFSELYIRPNTPEMYREI